MRELKLFVQELPFEIEEALNRLRVNVKFTDSDIHSIMVTSSIPNEGKSFTSFQLWRMLADAGLKTCLVDLDIRNSVFTSRFGARCEDGKELIGVDHYLSGLAELDDVIYSTNYKNGDIVPVSHVLENPSILLDGKRCKELIKTLSERYRYVLVDTAPLVNVSDASLIASYCDSALLVIRANYTAKKAVKHSLNQLNLAGCKILGSVLLRTESGARSYGKYYGKKYGYGKYGYGKYGDGYGYGKESEGRRKKLKGAHAKR